ncbi:MAG: hypothetical protein HGN29_05675 [Asgard group archaeon]|nr:hypothetical protein [Asgard group archaeon]
MKSPSVRRFFFVLSIIMLILVPYPAQAAKKSRSVKDENGMKITITCGTNASFISEDFRINLTLELTKKPDNVVKLFKIEMRIRLLDINSTERVKQTINFPDLYPNVTQRKSPLIQYDSEWGEVRLELKLSFFVDKTEPLPSIATVTNWISFLTLRTGSFTSNYYWIYIILGLITLIGIAVVVKWGFLNRK